MTKKRYIKGFDGLRAIAVVGVIFFHLLPSRFVGGWLGVPLFFVLSGYLITDLLIQEFDEKQHVNVVSFYIRRLKRLYPALVGMLLFCVTIILLFDQQLIYNLRYIVLTNLLYVYNFWAIGHGESYFQQFGGASPFTHLWSLSIEGQFYLVWPFVVWLVLSKQLKRGLISLVLLLLSALSAILMSVLYQPENINRVYYGTDTRLFAILIGAALAFSWPATRLNPSAHPNTQRLLDITGTVALIVTILGFMLINGQSYWTYHGLMYLFTGIVAVLIAVVAHPASVYSRLLDNPILNYLGQRSYSIYLYQLPVFVLYEQLVPHYRPTFFHLLAEIVLLFVLSELSYRYIESLFRKESGLKWQKIIVTKQTFIVTALVIFAFSFFIGRGLSSKRAGESRPETKLQKELKAKQKVVDKSNASAAKMTNKQTVTKNEKLTQAQQSIVNKYELNKAQFIVFSNMAFTAIGDSVMLDAAPYLQEVNPKMVVNAEVGRQAYQTPDLVDQLSKQGKLASNILIGLGTNGVIKRQDLDKMMTTFGKKRQVYWINNFVQNRSWQDANNKMLMTAEKSYRNLHIVDWHKLAKKHLDWFGDDEVHQGPTGDRKYVRLVVQTVGQTQNVE